MQETPGTSPNSSSPDPYDFILNPETSPKKSKFGLSLGTDSKLAKSLIFVTGFVVLIIVLIGGYSFINNASQAQTEKLVEIAKAQNEIVRITSSSTEKIHDRQLLYRATSTRVSTLSANQEIIQALNKRGRKLNDKDLAAGANSNTDALLLEAEQNGRFDQVFTEILDAQLTNYKIQIESAYKSAGNFEKQILESAFNQVEIISAKNVN